MKQSAVMKAFIGTAQEKALLFASPGKGSKRPSTPKTGTFTGYWDSGAVAWKGAFKNGMQVGLWTYYSPLNTNDTCQEFYCNL